MTKTPPPPESFAQRLGRLLAEANMSYYALAIEVGLPHQTIRRYVKGTRQPTFANAVKIARALNVSLETFAQTVPDKEK